MIALALSTLVAFADEPTAPALGLTSGELPDSAHSIEKGAFALHPLFQKSSWGITDFLEFKFGMLSSLVQGPRIGLEVSPLPGDAFAVSLEGEAAYGWAGSSKVGGDLHVTTALGPHDLTASVGYGHQKFIEIEGTALTSTTYPLRLGVDLSAGENTVFQLSVGSDAYLLSHDTTNWRFRGHWNHAMGERFRLALGLDLIHGELPDLPESVADELPSGITFPWPYLAMWWKL